MKNLDNYLNELKNTIGDRLESVFVYGAKADIPVYDIESDVDLIVIVNKLNAQDLDNVAKATVQWTKNGKQNPVPVFMSVTEWYSSCDVYPMEYTDIKEKHHVLFGENLITSIEVKKEDLRLQCELETKNLLMRFRKSYLMNSQNKDVIKEMLVSSTKTSFAIFKAVLRLKEIPVPVTKMEIIDLIAELSDIDKNLFNCLLSFKEKRCKLNYAQETAQKFIDEVDKLLNYTNNM